MSLTHIKVFLCAGGHRVLNTAISVITICAYRDVLRERFGVALPRVHASLAWPSSIAVVGVSIWEYFPTR